MRPPVTFAAVLLLSAHAFAAESEEQQWRRIEKRMRIERGITNFLQHTNIPIIRDSITHPSFGIWWHEVPPPNVTNHSAMVTVNAFIATNGWKMQTGTFDDFSFRKAQPIRGLPWDVIREREFLAVTHNGILYVMFS